MTAILIADESHWHSLRKQNVGATETPALFGESPYLTKFELWMQKQGLAPAPDLSDNERAFWGTIMQPAIARGVAERTGWDVRSADVYHTLLPELGLGASLDEEIVGDPRGPGLLEIKNVDRLQFIRWEDGQPPIHIELQVQTQFAASNYTWGCIAVLIGGNELRLYERTPRPQTIDLIEGAVAEFWQSIRDNKPPPPDFGKDGATLAQLYAAAEPGKVVDMSDSNRLPGLIAEYRRASAEEKAGKAAKDAAKAEMLPLIRDAERIICGEATISAKMVASTHVEYDRAAYRDFRVNEKRGKTDAANA
jgi:putative phage-type endonuclease